MIKVRIKDLLFLDKFSKFKMSSNTSKRKTKFPELPPKYSSSRELRNKAEKIRRDRLNGLIDEMKMLVPIICNK